MSQPKRYNLRLPQITYGMEESQDGEYVLHSDYAALAAENERLKADYDAMLKNANTYIAQLDLENKVLRKAGDNMFIDLECFNNHMFSKSPDYQEQRPTMKAWNAAKEGRDAK